MTLSLSFFKLIIALLAERGVQTPSGDSQKERISVDGTFWPYVSQQFSSRFDLFSHSNISISVKFFSSNQHYINLYPSDFKMNPVSHSSNESTTEVAQPPVPVVLSKEDQELKRRGLMDDEELAGYKLWRETEFGKVYWNIQEDKENVPSHIKPAQRENLLEGPEPVTPDDGRVIVLAKRIVIDLTYEDDDNFDIAFD
ncbi:unnamed protein product [Caenorhabditis auriculariae]|uniref:Uncharacterized protein n=1 Tax=Caenorhabditis auriculariae TaxID=2777116 RepID=A0A8S1H5B5_9PELO|nr:unnamed protein product [Caenorhabditis auriculariae]